MCYAFLFKPCAIAHGYKHISATRFYSLIFNLSRLLTKDVDTISFFVNPFLRAIGCHETCTAINAHKKRGKYGFKYTVSKGFLVKILLANNFSARERLLNGP